MALMDVFHAEARVPGYGPLLFFFVDSEWQLIIEVEFRRSSSTSELVRDLSRGQTRQRFHISDEVSQS